MKQPEAQTIEQAASGDAEAFMTLVYRYRAPLIAYVHGKTQARAESK